MSVSPFPPAGLVAGAATVDITPTKPVFLFGYPHVPRTSTGVHDPLLCSALFLGGRGAALFVSHDLIFVPRHWATDVRRRISAATAVGEDAILLSATHTHSGPNTVDQLSHAADPVVPPVDQDYLAWLADRVVATAVRAVRDAEPAEVGQALARAVGVGTNRHDPAGPADPDVPVLVARSRVTRQPIGCMVVYAMHPTVLHEDSTSISGDFPHFARAFLQRHALPPSCPIVYHNGASGDQSPRHVTRGNTFAEAQRIGELLGASIAAAIAGLRYTSDITLAAGRCTVDLTPRTFPSVGEAQGRLTASRARFDALKQAGAPGPAVRTAECDMFGAEETLELARAAANGALAAAIAARSPAEIQVLTVGTRAYVGWPGEFFVEYALAVRREFADAFVITLANGELQGYVVTPAAAARKLYEAGNAIFAPENGRKFVDATLRLLREGRRIA